MNLLDGVHWMMAMLLYGSGLRLRECLELRVKDLDFTYNQITVRDAKGDKDRVVPLPQKLRKPLTEQLEKVRKIHEKDLKEGYGSVYLPYALEKKYPNASKEFCWKFTP